MPDPEAGADRPGKKKKGLHWSGKQKERRRRLHARPGKLRRRRGFMVRTSNYVATITRK
jgi:hypothetical protein